MSILRSAKLLTLNVGKSIGVFQVLSRSEWRKNHLADPCVSRCFARRRTPLEPGSLRQPGIFSHAHAGAERLRCNVLPLTEALQQLEDGTLPQCSVVLTFDDGASDFYHRAFPILREFGWPATVYLTSYYCNYNRPVFDTMCSYLLWKGRGREVDVQNLIDGVRSLDLRSASGIEAATVAIREFSRRERFTAKKKDALLTAIAERLSLGLSSDPFETHSAPFVG